MDAFKEAKYYEKHDGSRVICRLCPHECRIEEGKSGICRVRGNREGKLYTYNYGKISAIAMDPVEKKPLYHFYPGRYLLSLGTLGCNFRCGFCQNYHIAQQGIDMEGSAYGTREASESYLLSLCRQEENCVGIAYTYNEPNVWFEYILETAKKFRGNGYKNVMVTNGYINQAPLKELLPFIDAFNIDVKGFTKEYYKNVCGGQLEKVMETVETAAGHSHVEVTTLVVPGLNDSEREMEELSRWLAGIKAFIPLHLSRYYPRYKMQEEPTPVEALKRLREVARKHLDYVYLGNVDGAGSNTYCPQCGALLVSRDSGIFYEHLDGNTCSKCGRVIEIIYE